jgi:hypothetical protein
MGWIDELKAGDDVIINQHPYKHHAKVDRVTETLVIVGLDRFRKRTAACGDGYFRRWITQPTPELLREVKMRALADSIARLDASWLARALVSAPDEVVSAAQTLAAFRKAVSP